MILYTPSWRSTNDQDFSLLPSDSKCKSLKEVTFVKTSSPLHLYNTGNGAQSRTKIFFFFILYILYNIIYVI